MEEEPKQYIVVFGDPTSGFEHHGPFDDPEDADAYADVYLDGDWWIVGLQKKN